MRETCQLLIVVPCCPIACHGRRTGGSRMHVDATCSSASLCDTPHATSNFSNIVQAGRGVGVDVRGAL